MIRAWHAITTLLQQGRPAAPGQHPLLVGDVFARSGLDALQLSDADVRTTCPVCGTDQTLADARTEPGAGPVVTVYRCLHDCTVLAATCTDPPADCLGCYRVGEHVIAVHVPAGLRFRS